MSILDEIAGKTRQRIAEEKARLPLSVLKNRAEHTPPPSIFQALSSPGISFICEVKRASPSKGVISPEFPYVEIAKSYESAGASAISCLTEPYWFQGRDQYVYEIAQAVSLPILRKDFTIDEYMIYQARAMGASAILLICAILEDCQLKDYLQLAHSLSIDVLVEAHDQSEIQRAIQAGAKIIGVNNRNLHTFHVDMANSIHLRHLVPESILFVAESGIQTHNDIVRLEQNGVDAVLIGETLMRANDKKAMLNQLRGVVR